MEGAKTNDVIVVTKEEHRAIIEKYTAENNITNPKFYFVDIPRLYKRLFKGVAYSVRLNIWHRKAFPLVKQICESSGVEVIHQITPIEFRSIGPYYKIPKVRFVCGPLGGGEYIPAGLKKYAFSNIHIEGIRRFLNCFYKMKYRLGGQLEKCDYFLFANRETREYMCRLIGSVDNELFFDNGISEAEISESTKQVRECREKTIFLVAGRMAYRKGHRLLLDTIKALPANIPCEFRLVGTGPEYNRLKRICKQCNLESRVVFTGRISFTEMQREYDGADAFIMPSIRETTGSVLLEAASRDVPVISLNRFGASVLFDEDSAYFYSGNKTGDYISSLKNAIIDCVENPTGAYSRAQGARQIAFSQTWDKKLAKYNEIYAKVLNRHRKENSL